MPVHGIFAALLNGVHDRGEGGVLLVKGEECAYLFPHELPDPTGMGESLRETLAQPETRSVFLVVLVSETRADVVAYPRERVYREAREAVAAEAEAAPGEAREAVAAEEEAAPGEAEAAPGEEEARITEVAE